MMNEQAASAQGPAAAITNAGLRKESMFKSFLSTFHTVTDIIPVWS
jgi:hypothetical protein